MKKVRFSDDFPPVSTEEWEESIRRDLEAAGVEGPLLWHTADGLTIRPYYRQEDLDRLDAAGSDELPPVRLPASFQVRQDIATPDLESARRHAAAAVEGGVDVLGLVLRVDENTFTGVPLTTHEAFAAFLDGLPLHRVSVHLDGGPYSPALAALFFDTLSAQFIDTAPSRRLADDIAFTIAFDPINEIVRSGRRLEGALDLAADMVERTRGQFPGGRLVRMGADAFHHAGATPVQETALLLASASELIVQLIERGVPARDLIERCFLSMPVGTSYFVEIAKLRALRTTFAQLLAAFVPEYDSSVPPLHSETSARPFTLYDPHVNMLRATTASASAVLGGCDVVAVRSCDEPAGRFDEFSYRMARNIGHLLRDEAGLDRVPDPAAGSYYIEVLTDAIARRAWQLFQTIEARGGLLDALESGYVHDLVAAVQTKRTDEFARGRHVLIGSNLHPDPNERRRDDLARAPAPVDLPVPEHSSYSGGFEPLRELLAAGEPISVLESIRQGPPLCPPFGARREAESLEDLRLRTEGRRRPPRIMIATSGRTAEARARTRFAVHFLGCGGFEPHTSARFDSADDLASAVRESNPDAVVLCASDDEMDAILPQVKQDYGDLTRSCVLIIVASPDVISQVDRSLYDLAIHDNASLLDALGHLQQRLRIVEGPVEVDS